MTHPYTRVEFMGLPGAGKTTLASRFLQEAAGRGQPLRSETTEILRALRARDDGRIARMLKVLPPPVWTPFLGRKFALPEVQRAASRHPELFAWVFQAIAELPLSPEFHECIPHDFLRTTAGHELLGSLSGESGPILCEEGFGQVGCLLAGYTEDGVIPEHILTRYVSCLPSLSAMVWLDIDPEVSLLRLRQREKMTIGLVGKTDPECLQVLRQSREGFRVLFEAFENRGIATLKLTTDQLSGDMQPEEWDALFRLIPKGS